MNDIIKSGIVGFKEEMKMFSLACVFFVCVYLISLIFDYSLSERTDTNSWTHRELTAVSIGYIGKFQRKRQMVAAFVLISKFFLTSNLDSIL